MFSPRLAPTVDAALAVGSTLRFDADQYSWRSQSSQFLRGRQMMIGSNFFHLGVLVLIVGGIAALISATLLLHRRLADPRIRRSSSFGDIAVLTLIWFQLVLGIGSIYWTMQHLDGGVMVQFMGWASGILRLDPVAAAQIHDVDLVLKLHIILGLFLFLIRRSRGSSTSGARPSGSCSARVIRSFARSRNVRRGECADHPCHLQNNTPLFQVAAPQRLILPWD